ncbi:MAG: ClcB-like voltage-gated chloride channel protein [Candidatus Dactylopiibacterium sp.]|nr:ClcB-like voltage-gated chloride channel protein [Candidatus Dactylopiibacterium sp.]
MPAKSSFLLRLRLALRAGHDDLHGLLWQAALVGVAGACAILAFREALAWAELLLYGRSDSLVAAAASLPPWLRMSIPAVGGVVAGGFIVLARRLRTDVANDYMEAISLRDGAISTRLSLTRSAASLASIASGGSIGREGSMVQLASLGGFLFARWRALPAPQRRLLVACGGAAGIAAAYNAPIAGTLFIAEIVLRTISIEILGPLVAASVVSAIVSHVFFGAEALYALPPIHAPEGFALAAHALLGVLAGLAAPLFMGSLDAARAAFRRLPDHPPLRLGLGGLLVGLISVWLPQVWGNGYSVVNGMLAGQWLWQALLVLLAFKVLATAITIGSGAIGGAFTPSLFVGAALGTLFGTAAQALGATSEVPVYVVSGMAAFLAATLHAPLTAIVIVVEMTGNLALLPPVMLASVIALALSRLLRARSIYGDSLKPLPARSFARRTVAEVRRDGPPVVQAGEPLAAIQQAYAASRWQHIYVVDAAGVFLGAVSIHALGELLLPQHGAASLPPEQLRRDYPRLLLDAPLTEALGVFGGHSGERLPVLDGDGRLRGYASKTDLMLLLGEEMAAV